MYESHARMLACLYLPGASLALHLYCAALCWNMCRSCKVYSAGMYWHGSGTTAAWVLYKWCVGNFQVPECCTGAALARCWYFAALHCDSQSRATWANRAVGLPGQPVQTKLAWTNPPGPRQSNMNAQAILLARGSLKHKICLTEVGANTLLCCNTSSACGLGPPSGAQFLYATSLSPSLHDA